MGKVCLGALVFGVLVVDAGRAQDRTTPILAEARQALGGETALGGIHGWRAVGAASRDAGVLRVSSTVEWLVAFPDRYLRIERVALGGVTSEVALGFSGDALLQWATGPGGVRIDPTAALGPASSLATAAAVLGARQDLARLLLGFVGGSPVVPLQFAFGGVAEAPDGSADVIDVRGADGFEARLFIDAVTRLPRMLSWMGPDVPGLIRRLSRTAADERGAALPTEQERLGQAGLTVEHRLYFADYRRVDAVRWPFQIRRSIGGEIVEELTFERFVLNPVFDPAAFAPDR
jgi:hypothetical protein